MGKEKSEKPWCFLRLPRFLVAPFQEAWIFVCVSEATEFQAALVQKSCGDQV